MSSKNKIKTRKPEKSEKEKKREGKEPTITSEKKREGSEKKRGRKVLSIIGKILGSTAGIVIIAALIAKQIPYDRQFSINITSKGLNIKLSSEKEAEPITITTHPSLKEITISADNIKMTTTEFAIEHTNEPKLKKIKGAHALQANSENPTYYGIENKTSITIPTIITFQTSKDKTRLNLEFKERNERESVTDASLPHGKTTIKLSTENSLLKIHNSKITYGTQTTKTGGKEIIIVGKPEKIGIDAESTKNILLTFHIQKGDPCDVTFDNDISKLITKLRFFQANPKSTIHIARKEPIQLKDKYVQNPNIKIKGSIEKIQAFQLTDEGIQTKMEGRYGKIKIAETLIKNTYFDEGKELLQEILPFLK